MAPRRRGGPKTSPWATIALYWLLVWWTPIPGMAQHYVTSSYGMAAGLANLNVSALLEDHTGAVWVGTDSGVYLADGERFHKQAAFSAAGLEVIRVLREDGAGRIWAMDSRHLVYWDGHALHSIEGLDLRVLSSDAIDLVSPPGEPDSMYLMRCGKLWRIASADHGGSWTVSSALQPALVAHHPELKALTSVVAGAHSAVWAGCGRGLCRIDLRGQTAESFGEREGVRADTWRRLLWTRTGTLWARGERDVLVQIPGTDRFTAMPQLPGSESLNVQSPALVEDPSGRIVLNLAAGLAARLPAGTARSSGGEWRMYAQANGLPEDIAETLMFDRSGQLWIGPQGHGLVRWQGYGHWEGWSKAEGLSSNITWSLAGGGKGPVWVTTERGLDRLDGGARRVTPLQTSLPMPRLRAVALDERGHLWIGDAAGQVMEFNPKTGRTRIAAAGLGRVVQLLADQKQRVWVCSLEGLRYFSPDDGWSAPHEVDRVALPRSYAWSIAEDHRGTLWLTTGRGLYRLERDTWSAIRIPFPGGVEYNFLVAPAADGTLWAQSKQPYPLLHLKVSDRIATQIGQVEGATFGSDNITFMETDQRGWLWVGSDDGVHVYNGDRWVQCTSEDGLLWDDTDARGFMADRDGSVWISTSGGLSHLVHPEWLFAQPPPRLRVMRARVGEKDVDGRSPKFDLRRPALTVGLLDTNYSRGAAIVYRYRLEGQDTEWQEEHTGSLRFSALDAGSYRLSVAAYDVRRHESSQPLSLSFTVLEPWWRRGWFRLLEAFAAVLLLFWGWRLSVHLLMSRQRRLERLVRVRTRELEMEKNQLLQTRSTLLEMARRDSLTGLLNRGAIFERMEVLCDAAFESGRPLAVGMADLDFFKRINDEHGHIMGDTVLRECARRIEAAIRPEDAVGRYGGEELLILMPGLQPESAAARMEQLRTAIAAAPVLHGETGLTVTCSFGVAWSGGERCSIESLVGLADAALYLAKQNGRNRVEFAAGGRRERATDGSSGHQGGTGSVGRQEPVKLSRSGTCLVLKAALQAVSWNMMARPWMSGPRATTVLLGSLLTAIHRITEWHVLAPRGLNNPFAKPIEFV